MFWNGVTGYTRLDLCELFNRLLIIILTQPVHIILHIMGHQTCTKPKLSPLFLFSFLPSTVWMTIARQKFTVTNIKSRRMSVVCDAFK